MNIMKGKLFMGSKIDIRIAQVKGKFTNGPNKTAWQPSFQSKDHSNKGQMGTYRSKRKEARTNKKHSSTMVRKRSNEDQKLKPKFDLSSNI